MIESLGHSPFRSVDLMQKRQAKRWGCRGNFQKAATSPCKEMLEHREKSSNEKLADLDGKMEAVVGWAKAGYVDFSKFDFTPRPTCL